MRRIKRGLNQAIGMAGTSTHDMRVGCVLYNRTRPTVWGVNHNRTHPRSLSRYGKIHAEMDAAICPIPVKGYDAYVARLTKPGKVAMAKPCDSCMTLLRHSGIKNVYWTITEGKWGTLRLN